MKICFLTDDPSKVGGGPEHLREVSNILRKKFGYTVDIITPLQFNPDFNVNNFFHRVLFALYTLSFLLSTDYDIYHSHTFSTSAFLPLAKLRGRKTGVTIHGEGKTLVGSELLNKTFIPQFLAFLILKIWPFDFRLSASNLPGFVTVGNGVDIGEFSKIKHASHKVFTILCISRRDPVKGIDVLEQAIKEIPDIKLNLVSGRQRTMADFTQADCYVLPSLSEGLPIVLLEAMSASLPVIVTDVGDCREIVEKANCGVVVPPGDSQALTRAILQMKDNKDRAKMGEAGHAYVQKHFTWEKVAAFYALVYRGANPLV